MFANDPAHDADDLDRHGLHWRTAHAIVDARPIADLAALDAVPTVGPIACRVLRDRACNEAGMCEPTLDLWTWNIEHFPLTESALPAVASTLATGAMGLDGTPRPEIVGFEEADSVPAFQTLLGMLPGWEGLVGREGFSTQVAIAYRTDRLTVVATEDLFTNDPDRFPRPPLAVTFDVRGRAGTARFTVVTVHLKAQVDLDSRDRRRRAVIALEQWLAARRAQGDRVIVVGDWNDDIDAPADRNVFLPLLDHPDAYTALTLAVAQRGEFSYIPFHRLIDHLVMTHEAAVAMPAELVEPVKLDLANPSYATTVSDHRPVHARLVPIVPAP
ncbi:MAG TPA: endonuclease/exonuclease/phosphatase family protein [Kofleriaceae bacterium]|nr:endonuclease/exonuclease/phosphatase family protein [Kofleriaceae bacterium]